MNKEVVIAIVIGVAMGIGGALYFSNAAPPTKKPETNTLVRNSVQITPILTGKSGGQLSEFANLPKSETLLTKNTLKIEGKADNKSLIVVADRLEIKPLQVKNGSFSEEFRLKPGMNEIVLYESLKEKEQLKILKLYYLELAKQSNSEPEATEEADILKAKLEAKVLELRNKPQKVFSGEITALSAKQITISHLGQPQKITVEPEITNFSDVSAYALLPIEFADLAKGDTVTAFVSDIGGDEISYTLYREPVLTVAAAKVSNIDDKNYKITLVDFDKSSFGTDIETSTMQTLYDTKSKKVVKGGFSKLSIGQRIFARLSGEKDDYSIDEYLIID